VRFSPRLQHHRPDIYSEANKSLRNLGNKANISLHALLTSKKLMTGFFEINFGGFCRIMALIVSCCLPLSLSTANQGWHAMLFVRTQRFFVCHAFVFKTAVLELHFAKNFVWKTIIKFYNNRVLFAASKKKKKFSGQFILHVLICNSSHLFSKHYTEVIEGSNKYLLN